MADGITAESHPYRWPWHGAFDPSRTALLVAVDGARGLPDAALVTLLAGVATEARTLGVTIMELLGEGAPPVLPKALVDCSMTRPHFGGFTGTDLDSVLRRRGLTDLLIAGFPFELGGDCTMRQANDLGYECLALTDCCTGMAPDTLAGAIASIQMSGGIFGAVAAARPLLALFDRYRTVVAATANQS